MYLLLERQIYTCSEKADSQQVFTMGKNSDNCLIGLPNNLAGRVGLV